MSEIPSNDRYAVVGDAARFGQKAGIAKGTFMGRLLGRNIKYKSGTAQEVSLNRESVLKFIERNKYSYQINFKKELESKKIQDFSSSEILEALTEILVVQNKLLIPAPTAQLIPKSSVKVTERKLLNDGTIEVGEFKGGKLNGAGRRTRPDGTIESGNFKEGNLSGESCHKVYKDTSGVYWLYLGRFKDGNCIFLHEKRQLNKGPFLKFWETTKKVKECAKSELSIGRIESQGVKYYGGLPPKTKKKEPSQ